MLYREVSKIVSTFLFIFSTILLIPFFVAVYYQFLARPEAHPQPHSTLAFFETIITTLSLALIFRLWGRNAEGKVYRREGILIVSIIWILTSSLGALPFYFSGTLKNPVQALFEATSGFSTTGSTVMESKKFDSEGFEVPIKASFHGIEHVEYEYYGTIQPIKYGDTTLEGIDAVSRGVIFWRSMIQWLGGLGIMVLFVAILPAIGAGGKVLMQSEVTGPIKSSMTPRIKETAIQLWKIYTGLTIIEIILLYSTNRSMTLFDSILLSFSTLSTGGFTPHNNGLDYWNHTTTSWIVIVFMILGSINFSLYYFCLKGKLYKLWDMELATFLLIVVSISLFAAYQLNGTPLFPANGIQDGIYTPFKALTDGTFQLVAALTSTGFYTADYDFWPYEIQVLMLMVMYIGGMSGSTAGGIKVIRHILLFLFAKNRIESFYRPEAIRSLKVGNREIDNDIALNVLIFFFLVMAISVTGTFFYSIDGVDPETSLGLTSCMVNNVGLAFRQAGPLNSCAFLTDFSCLLSCLLMLLGRLEFIVILVLFVPAFWKEAS